MKQKNEVQKNKNLKQGFTLLELLVVVLIIGILAGIALPKYQLAVDKTEFAKYRLMAANLREAYTEYIMLHGKGTKKFEDLSLEIPENLNIPFDSYYYSCLSNDDMFCCISTYAYKTTGAGIACGKRDKSIAVSESLLDIEGNASNKKRCMAGSERGKRVCSFFGEEEQKHIYMTPDGWYNATHYLINKN